MAGGAARTPASTYFESAGDLALKIYKFTEIDDTDTFDSGLAGVVGFWANATDAATTTTNAGVDVAESSGVFTFATGEHNRTVDLIVLATEYE